MKTIIITTIIWDISETASLIGASVASIFDWLVLVPINILNSIPFVQNIIEEFFPPLDSKRIWHIMQQINKVIIVI